MSKGAIAQYLQAQADWRDYKATQYPDDPRNEWCSEGLAELAEYVLGLPDDDPRIVELSTLCVDRGEFVPVPDESVAYMVARFRFHDRNQSCDEFLTDLVSAARDDAIRWAEQNGVLPN